jgi:hypothetical protein
MNLNKKVISAKNINTESKNILKDSIYDINPAVLNNPMGYSAEIDGTLITVIPNSYINSYNRNNENISSIEQNGYVMLNNVKTESGKFQNLTSKQLYQLVLAGVIILNPEQSKIFKEKFYKKL